MAGVYSRAALHRAHSDKYSTDETERLNESATRSTKTDIVLNESSSLCHSKWMGRWSKPFFAVTVTCELKQDCKLQHTQSKAGAFLVVHINLTLYFRS